MPGLIPAMIIITAGVVAEFGIAYAWLTRPRGKWLSRG